MNKKEFAELLAGPLEKVMPTMLFQCPIVSSWKQGQWLYDNYTQPQLKQTYQLISKALSNTDDEELVDRIYDWLDALWGAMLETTTEEIEYETDLESLKDCK